MNMQDKVVLITGATGHLGHAVVQAFSERGARLVLLGRSLDSLRSSFGEPGESRFFVAADLTQAEPTVQAVQTAIAHFARIDVLCHLTGGFLMRHRLKPGIFCWTLIPARSSILHGRWFPTCWRQAGARSSP